SRRGRFLLSLRGLCLGFGAIELLSGNEPLLAERARSLGRAARELFGRRGGARLGVGAFERGAFGARVELDERIADFDLLSRLDGDLFYVPAHLGDDADALAREDVGEVLARIAYGGRSDRQRLDLARRGGRRLLGPGDAAREKRKARQRDEPPHWNEQ